MTSNKELRRIAYTPEERIEKLEQQVSTLAEKLIETNKQLETQEEDLDTLRDDLLEEMRGIAEQNTERHKLELEIPRERIEQEVELKPEEETEVTVDDTPEEDQEQIEEVEDEETREEDNSETSEYFQLKPEARKQRMKQTIKQAEEPLTINEIIAQTFDEDVDTGEGMYNNASALLKEMRENQEIKADKKGRKTVYGSGKRHFNLKKDDQEDIEQLKEDLEDLDSEEQLEPNEFTVEERMVKIVELLEQYEPPLTMKEMARLIYNIPLEEEVVYSTPYYNRMLPAQQKLKHQGRIEEADPRTRNGIDNLAKVWKLKEPEENKEEESEEAEEETSQKEEKEQQDVELEQDKQSEELDFERIKREAGVSDSDVQITANVLDKIINQNGKDYVSYHLFEKHYSGEERPLRMFQKLFQNSELLLKLRDKVAPGREFKWVKKQRGNYDTGVKNWVIKVE